MNAFPTLKQEAGFAITEPGMDLRDYFAAKAMQGMIINLDLRPNTHNIGIVGMDIGAFSYWMADVMMKAREKKDA